MHLLGGCPFLQQADHEIAEQLVLTQLYQEHFGTIDLRDSQSGTIRSTKIQIADSCGRQAKWHSVVLVLGRTEENAT